MKLFFAAATILLATTAAAQPHARSPAERMFRMPVIAQPNPAHCRTPRQQVAEETRRDRTGEAHRLDREPPAAMILAVDRQVGACHELTFARRALHR